MTKECAAYLNMTAGRWSKERSDAAIEKIRKATCASTMVFTVTDSESPSKPIVYARLANTMWLKDHEGVKEALIDWFNSNAPEVVTTDELLDDLAYNIRHDGYAWCNERYCFELTVVNG